MTVNRLAERLQLEKLCIPDGDREIDGAYAGDLLSWVMGRAKPGNCWATIMTNVNTLAVASLLDLSCIIFCENSELSADIINAAEAKEINLLRTGMSEYELCVALGAAI